MGTLWLKFPDETLASHSFSDEEQRKLNLVFSESDPHSPWREALTLLSLQASGAQIIKWVSGCPYFNWSEMTRLISGGMMSPARSPDGHYTFTTNNTLSNLSRLLATQWKITRFLTRPGTGNSTLAESIALGICLQSLILRLGGNIEIMATALADFPKAKARDRKVLEQIQAIQIRRTQISNVWNDLLPVTGEDINANLPDYFWDNDAPVALRTNNSVQTEQKNWKGLAVCTGQITGLAVIVGRHDTEASLNALASQYNAPLILIFRNARPQSVEYFPCAKALLFAEGGILSHACTVAREMNIPAITGLGQAFFTQMENSPKTWLTLDGQTGKVIKID